MTSRPMSNIDKRDGQVQRYANFGVDMMEWADGGYVKYSDYVALLDELEAKDAELQEYRKADDTCAALASLEAEPVCVIDQSNLDYLKSGSDADVWPASRTEMGDVLLYRTAPPAPVSVPDELSREEYKRRFMEEENFDDTFRGGWNACRAAMLQGADGKPELTVWYGAMPETNGKTNWTAILHRKGECISTGITIDRSEYPDRARYEADRMRYLIGEISEEPDTLAYDADAHSGYVKTGNSPVIPDGWVMVPVEPTMSQEFAGYRTLTDTGKMSRLMKTRLSNIYRAMIAAAPQQEA